MPRDYATKILAPENAAQAYPLVQSARPEVTLEAWTAYAERMNAGTVPPVGEKGIVAIESKRGYIHGLFSFWITIALRHGDVLNVENFIAVDMGDRAAAIKTLIRAVDDLARTHGCAAVYTHLPDHWVFGPQTESTMLSHLRDAGHDLESVKLCKMIGAF